MKHQILYREKAWDIRRGTSLSHNPSQHVVVIKVLRECIGRLRKAKDSSVDINHVLKDGLRKNITLFRTFDEPKQYSPKLSYFVHVTFFHLWKLSPKVANTYKVVKPIQALSLVMYLHF